jgi:hypothetical protein
MTGSTALDVVIGLIFIYSLYSLLTTTLTELIATWIQMRAAFLHKAIRRMLDDDSGTNIFSVQFFKQPLIKYMASGPRWFAHKPAYLSSNNFAKNLIETLKQAYLTKLWEDFPALVNGATAKSIHPTLANDIALRIDKMVSKDRFNVYEIRDILEDPAYVAADPQTVAAIAGILDETERQLNQPVLQKILDVLRDPKREIGHSETVRHLRSLLEDAQNDLEKFNALLAQWYDDTMERVTGWYKHRIQIITFFLGLGIAIVFNADTIFIVNTLSRDDDSRDQLVQMASAYIQSHPPVTVCDSCESNARLDSLLKVKKAIEADIHATNSLLGLGWDFPDSLPLLSGRERDSLITQGKTRPLANNDFIAVNVEGSSDPHYIQLTQSFTKPLARRLLEYNDHGKPKAPSLLGVNKAKTGVALSEIKLFWTGLGGFILTAFAISLGAPFWFDLLNKLVKLRSSIKPAAPPDTTEKEEKDAPVKRP